MTQKIIGSRIIHMDRVDSTNRFIMQQMEDHHFPEGCMVVAHTQFAGRGMGTNLWESEPGKNLTFSVVLYPCFLPLEKQFMLNKMVSLSLCDYAGQLLGHEKVRIKWPNDLYIGDKKVAGILINNMIQGASFVTTVVGIGFNINQIRFTSDAPNPVSLKNITGTDYDLDRCLIDLSRSLDLRYRELKLEGFHSMDEDYLTRQYRLGRFYPFYYKNKRVIAMIKTVDDYGRLILKTSEGDTLTADQKEITFIIETTKGEEYS